MWVSEFSGSLGLCILGSLDEDLGPWVFVSLGPVSLCLCVPVSLCLCVCSLCLCVSLGLWGMMWVFGFFWDLGFLCLRVLGSLVSVSVSGCLGLRVLFFSVLVVSPCVSVGSLSSPGPWVSGFWMSRSSKYGTNQYEVRIEPVNCRKNKSKYVIL